MLNIITTKEKAAPSANSGACRERSARRTFREAVIQIGIITAYRGPKVCGERYPSGMCIESLLVPLCRNPPATLEE
jgi:hypothetical protein